MSSPDIPGATRENQSASRAPTTTTTTKRKRKEEEEEEEEEYLVAMRLGVTVAQVALAIGLGGEGVLALAALVGPLAVVRAHVADQRALVGRRRRAHVAPVRRTRQVVPVVTCRPQRRRQQQRRRYRKRPKRLTSNRVYQLSEVRIRLEA